MTKKKRLTDVVMRDRGFERVQEAPIAAEEWIRVRARALGLDEDELRVRLGLPKLTHG